MNGNFKYTISDETRNHMSIALSGRVTKRMVSRSEITNFLQGCLDNMCLAADSLTQEVIDDVVVEDTTPKFAGMRLTPAEETTVVLLRDQGSTENYIRGWIQVGRRKGL